MTARPDQQDSQKGLFPPALYAVIQRSGNQGHAAVE